MADLVACLEFACRQMETDRLQPDLFSCLTLAFFFSQLQREINTLGSLICYLMVDGIMFTCAGKIGHEAEKKSYLTEQLQP